MKKYLPLFISGLLMIFVGLYMILRPDSFLTVVISVFGIYLIVDGIRTMIASYKLRDVFGRGLRNMSAAKALIDIILGVVVVIIAIASPSLIICILNHTLPLPEFPHRRCNDAVCGNSIRVRRDDGLWLTELRILCKENQKRD